MIECRECGQAIAAAAKTCPNCGVPDPNTNAMNAKSWGSAAFAAVVSIVAGIGAANDPNWVVITIAVFFGVSAVACAYAAFRGIDRSK
jgi:ribosomal protein L37E